MMQKDLKRFSLLELSAQLVNANRQFVEALKKEVPHAELTELFADIQELHSQIKVLRDKGGRVD